MKIIAIALFEFLVLASISAGCELTMFGGNVGVGLGGGVNTVNMTNDLGNATGMIQEIAPAAQGLDYWAAMVWSAVKLLFAVFAMFLKVILHTLTIGFYMQSLFPWIPTSFAALFTLGADLVLVIAAVQFLSGRAGKVME